VKNEMSNTIKKSIVSKIVWAILGFAALYIGASLFGLVPKSMTDFIAYLQRNTELFVIAICFLAACYVIVKIKTQRGGNYSET
jgi:hypothetical protein